MNFEDFLSRFSELSQSDQLDGFVKLRDVVKEEVTKVPRNALFLELKEFKKRMTDSGFKASTSQLSIMYEARLITADRTASGFPVDLRVPAFQLLSPEVLKTPREDLEIDPILFQLFMTIRRIYENEALKVDAIFPLLEQYLNGQNWKTFDAQGKKFVDEESDVRVGRADIGTYIRGLGIPLLIIEVKNEEHSSSKSDSSAQAGAYYLNFLDCKQDLIVSNFPCIILTIRAAAVNCYGMVYGDAANRGPKDIADCSHLAGMDVSRSDSFTDFAWFMHNLKEAMYALEYQHLEDLVTSLRPDYDYLKYRFPDLTTFQYGEETIPFKYLSVTAAGQFVFEAVIEASSLPAGIKTRWIIVKFITAKKYPADIHEAMAKKGFAPELYAIMDLNLRGWKAIIMEDVRTKNNLVIAVDDYSNELTEDHRRKEMEMLAYLHNDLGHCHGDLRDNNIIFYRANKKGEVGLRVVDFDWAGLVGKAKYPCNINEKVDWAEGVKAGGLMRFEHDLHLFENRYQHLAQLTTTSMQGARTYQEAPGQGTMEPMEDLTTEGEQQNLAGMVHPLSPLPTSKEEAQASKKARAGETLPVQESTEESVAEEGLMESRALEPPPASSVAQRTRAKIKYEELLAAKEHK